MLGPKDVVAHLGIDVDALVALELECLVGDDVKREVAVFGSALFPRNAAWRLRRALALRIEISSGY